MAPYLPITGLNHRTLITWLLALAACAKEAPQNHIDQPVFSVEPVGASVRHRCAGATLAGQTKWRDYRPGRPGLGLVTIVDTSACGYDKAPIYSASLGGQTGHWSPKGSASIYNATAESFTVYLDTKITAQEANNTEDQEGKRALGWKLQWEAHPARPFEFAQCAGQTMPGQTEWKDDGKGGLTLRVNTQKCLFNRISTPSFFTALGGATGHWKAVGHSAIINPSAAGFSINIPNSIVTAKRAKEIWHLNWNAVSDRVHEKSESVCIGHANNWREYRVKGSFYVDVDTSHCSFEETPHYFTSLEGQNHSQVTGSNAIYFPTPKGFRVYVRGNGAKSEDFRLRWKAVRKRTPLRDLGVVYQSGIPATPSGYVLIDPIHRIESIGFTTRQDHTLRFEKQIAPDGQVTSVAKFPEDIQNRTQDEMVILIEGVRGYPMTANLFGFGPKPPGGDDVLSLDLESPRGRPTSVGIGFEGLTANRASVRPFSLAVEYADANPENDKVRVRVLTRRKLGQPEAVCEVVTPIAIDDVSQHFAGRMTSTDGFVSGTCGGGNGPEQVFAFTVDEPTDLYARVWASNMTPLLYIRSNTCEGEEIACQTAPSILRSPAEISQRLEPGTYFLFVDGTRHLGFWDRELPTTYTVDIQFARDSQACRGIDAVEIDPTPQQHTGVLSTPFWMHGVEAGVAEPTDVYTFTLEELTRVRAEATGKADVLRIRKRRMPTGGPGRTG